MKFIKLYKLLFFIGALLVFNACSDDDAELGPAPSGSFTISTQTELKQGEEITFTSDSEIGKSFFWSFGDGNTSYGKTSTHIYTAPGDYTITLEISANGQRSLSQQQISIEGIIPEAAFSVENADQLFVGTPVNFINESSQALSYTWDFGDSDGSTSNEENPTFTYNSPGSYEVTLTASNTGGQDSFTATVIINPNEKDELFFIDNDAVKIRKVAIEDPTVVQDVLDLNGYCFGLAFDPVNDELYYSDIDNGNIYKNSINGGNETLVASGLDGPRDIALDLANNRLFITERGIDQITMVDINNGSKTVVYSVADDPGFLLPVGLDLYNDELYATAVDIGAETVWKGNVNGSSLNRIIDYASGGYGYGLGIDKVNEKIYFDDTDTGQILMADLDGTNISSIGSTSDRVYGIAIDNENNAIYWASSFVGEIKVAGLDGSNEDIFLNVNADVTGIILRKAN